MVLTRRAAMATLAGGSAVGLMPWLRHRTASAQPVPRDATFDVLLGKDRIGRHAMTFRPEGDGFRAITDIELKVKLAFITLLDLRHESEELWQGGRLVELRSSTNDGGDVFEVVAEATLDGIRVRSPAGSIIAPPGIHTSNGLWDVAALEADQLIDAQNGGIIGLVAEPMGTERVEVAGRPTDAERYRIVTPAAAGDLWYAGAEFVKGRLEVRGELIDYRRVA